jgi:NTP pyrophosphatase (non-canonical NTP hydrolase)
VKEFFLMAQRLERAVEAGLQADGSKGHDDLAEELADAALFLVSLAEMVGADLQEAVEAKLAKNAVRTYQRLPSGVLVKSGPAAPQG